VYGRNGKPGDLVLQNVEREHNLRVELKQLKLNMVVLIVREKIVKTRLVQITLLAQVRTNTLY
jgi:hypothetical protein